MPVKGYDQASSTVRAALDEAARLTGVSPDYLAATVGRESTFNPNAKNTRSSASGLAQFTDDTWARTTAAYGKPYGITPETSRFDPRASAIMLGELTKANAASFRKRTGRAANDGDLYGMHFMGAGGYSDLAMADPNANAAALFPKQAKASPSIFNGRTVGQVLANLTSGKGATSLPQPSGVPDLYETEPEAPKHKFDLLKGYREAAEQEQLQVMAVQYARQMGDASLAPDPNFRWTPELIQQKTGELDEKSAQWVVDSAQSGAHADYLVKRVRKEQEASADLGQYGFIGNFGLRAAAILTDVPSWLLGAGIGKLAMLGRAGLAARAVETGLVAAATNAPLELMKAQVKPGYTAGDALLGTASAFAMGTAFGKVFGRAGDDLDRVLDREGAAARKATLEDMGHTLTPEGQAHYDTILGKSPGQAPRSPADGGAAAVVLRKPDIVDRLQVSPLGRLQGRDNSAVREIAAKLDNNLMGDGGASLRAEESAFEMMRRTNESLDAEVSRAVEGAFDRFASRNGVNGFQKAGSARDAFEEAVGREIVQAGQGTAPEIVEAARAYQRGFRQWVEKAKAAGAEWAESVPPNARYFPMIFDRERVREAIARFDEDGVVSVVRQALQAARPEAEEALVERVAQKYVRTVSTSVEGLEGSRANALAGLDREGLVDLLTEQGLDPADARSFVEAFKPTQATGPRQFRKRTLLDDTTKFVPEGGRAEDAFSIRDLTKGNAEEVWLAYNRSMAGHVAMAKQGFQTRGQFESHIKDITLGSANTRPGYTDAAAKSDYKDLQYLGKAIYGIPVRDMDTAGAKIESIFGNLNFARFMGQSGIAQLADVPKIMLKTSMSAAFQTFRMGDMANVLRRGGVEAEALARDLEVITGVGTMGARGKIVQRFREIDSFYPDSKAATYLDRAVRTTKTAANVTALVSGMTPVTDFLQRWAVRSSMQHLADLVGGRAVGEKVLNDLGLGRVQMAEFRELVGHMKLSPSGVVEDLNLAKLREVNPVAVDKLGAWLSRQARTTILETSPGNLPRWMGESAFRFMGQFRAFTFAAHAGNTLHNIKMGPAYAAQSLMTTGAWSAALYMLHTYSKSIGRDDQAEYLEKNLDPVRVIASGFNRSSDAGILPQVIDTALFPVYRATGVESPFSNARTTGLAAGIQGTPLVSLAVDATEAVGNGAMALGGRKDFSKQDAQRITRLMPLNNTYVISNALKAITQHFDDESYAAVHAQ